MKPKKTKNNVWGLLGSRHVQTSLENIVFFVSLFFWFLLIFFLGFFGFLIP